MLQFHELGIECFHLTLNDDLFNTEVLPALKRVAASLEEPLTITISMIGFVEGTNTCRT